MSEDNLCVVLVGTTHPGNIGAAARAMKTMGIGDLRLAAAECEADAQSHAMAGHAGDVVEGLRRFATLEEAVADCSRVYGLTARTRREGVPPVDPRGAAAEARRYGAGHGVAFVFGREHSGLTNRELGLCHRLVHIPANPAYSSLNLAAAVQVVCYELRMAAEADVSPDRTTAEPAPVAHLTGLYEQLERLALAVGFADEAGLGSMGRKLRRLLQRADPERAEVNLLRGLLSAVERALGR